MTKRNDSFLIQNQCRFVDSLQNRKLFNVFWRKVYWVVIDQYVFEFAIVVFWRNEDIIHVRYRIWWNNDDIYWCEFILNVLLTSMIMIAKIVFKSLIESTIMRNDFVSLLNSMTNSLIEILSNEVSMSMFSSSKNWMMKFSFWLSSNSMINCFKRCLNLWRDFHLRLRFVKRFLTSSRFFQYDSSINNWIYHIRNTFSKRELKICYKIKN